MIASSGLTFGEQCLIAGCAAVLGIVMVVVIKGLVDRITKRK